MLQAGLCPVPIYGTTRMPCGLQAAMVSARMSRLPSSGWGLKRTPGILAYLPMTEMRTVLAFIRTMVSARASASYSSRESNGGS